MLISWSAPTDDGGSPLTLYYKVYKNDGQGAGYQEIAGTSISQTNYEVTGLTPDTEYFFKIKTFNEVGESGLSNGAGFEAGSIPS